GSGQICANGGDGGPQSGGGGGGRIAVILNQPNNFNGTITAFGGDGYARGGAGTVFLRPNSRTDVPQVFVDNGGQVGTNTSWVAGGGPFQLTIRGGAIVAPPPQQQVYNVFIGTNSWLRLTNQTVNVLGDVQVEAGGGIIADGTGLANGQGLGAGRSVNVPGYGYLGGGGGYGGQGGDVTVKVPVASGGLTYGSLTAPLDRGSSGGSYNLGYGGLGGGAIRLIISGTLELEGALSAQGMPGAIPGAGGGSGGSIWLTVGTLTGSGSIAANGGSGNGYGGGGGGGRIALEYGLNSFAGTVTAFGGSGSSSGGAGTIYLKPKSQASGQVLVDNGGVFGHNTMLGSLTTPYTLTIQGGASVEVTNSSLLLSNLHIGLGGSLSVARPFKQLSIAVLRDAVLDAGGSINLDGKGYAAMTGPGSGTTTNSVGSGGGYGGTGGASSLQPGGAAYGSISAPADPGSSGGFGFGTWTNGSEGGGALRLSVGGALTLNGAISANGNPGVQDDAGGGAGGSVWISANVLTGTGQVLATGGEGELFQGGGGGGGRIAIYSPANLFSGWISAAGGDGFGSGQDGTIYYASTLPPLTVLGQTPSNGVSYAVSSVDITFNTAINQSTITGADPTLSTPNGLLTSDQLVTTLMSAGTVRFSFPPQTAEGDYTLTVGTQLQGQYGETLTQAYVGRFTINWPVIQGAIADALNQPVPGVRLQPDGGLPSVQTDARGAYSLKVVPGGNFTIVPSRTNLLFVPGVRTYANVTIPILEQNYLAVGSVAPTASFRSDSNGSIISWQTIPGVMYQAYSSSNLVDWVPYGAQSESSNGVAQLSLPGPDAPRMFFRIRASY
ncbi:MAG TPA: hypothetical protein VHI52_20350, partial [Verrucomicrobiae bacterium]|nr:hypothetical protein [Verrucomicrobiae bacterium]